MPALPFKTQRIYLQQPRGSDDQFQHLQKIHEHEELLDDALEEPDEEDKERLINYPTTCHAKTLLLTFLAPLVVRLMVRQQ